MVEAATLTPADPAPTTVIGSLPPATGADVAAVKPSGEEAGESSWYETLDTEEYRTNESLQEFDSVDDLAKAFLDKPDAPAVPTAEEYTLPEEFPLKDFGKFAHESGFTQEQVDRILQYDSLVREAHTKATEQVSQKHLDTLLESWGEDREANIQLARRALTHFDGEGKLGAFLEESQAGNHPLVVEFMYNLGQTLKEDGYLKSEVLHPGSKQAPENILYPDQGKS